MKYSVGIDNGHGINTPGKRCPDDSMREWSFNHAVATLLKPRIEKCGIDAHLVSDTNQDTSIGTRVSRANSKKVTIFVSIHANAYKGVWGSANGIETLYAQSSSKGKSLSSYIQKRLIAKTKRRDRGIIPRTDLGVLNQTSMPATLVECGFMDNKEEAALLKSNSYRIKCADAICEGICDYLKVKYIPFTSTSNPTPPPTQPETGLYEPKDSNAVTTAVLNVRTGRGTNHPVIGQLKNGQKIKLLSLSNGWWSVDVPLEWSKEGYGFVSQDFVKKTK